MCIVSDGRAKINARTLSVLAAMGVYQDGVAKNTVAGKPVTAHIYEYTTQLSINPDLQVRTAQDGVVPVQVLFCLKEKKYRLSPPLHCLADDMIATAQRRSTVTGKSTCPAVPFLKAHMTCGRWFFNAFAPILQPNVCVLLDVGTQPGPTSIYKLWKTCVSPEVDIDRSPDETGTGST